jgi:hypothetical protein
VVGAGGGGGAVCVYISMCHWVSEVGVKGSDSEWEDMPVMELDLVFEVYNAALVWRGTV